MTFSPGFQSNH